MRHVVIVALLLPLAGCLDVPEDPVVPDIAFEVEREDDGVFLVVARVNGTHAWTDFAVTGCPEIDGTVRSGDMLGPCVEDGMITVRHIATSEVVFSHDVEPPTLRDPVTWTIIMEGNRFVDGSITIQVGDSVVWVHEDQFTPHDVRSKQGSQEDFYSGDMYETVPGYPDTWSYTFEEVGENPYFCTYHAGTMDETITVVARHDATP